MSEAPLRTNRFLAVLAVTLSTATVSFDGNIPSVALPTIARELGVAGSHTVAIISTYQIILVVMLLPVAALAERIGHRRMLRIGLLTFVVGGLLCTLARTLPVLVALRIIQALGAAAILSVGSALIRSLYPINWLGRGLALNTLITTATTSLAPTVGGLMLSVLPWYWLFGIGVPSTVVALLLSRVIPESEKHQSPFDIRGAIYCMASFGLVLSGIECVVHGAAPGISVSLLGLGALVSVRFVKRELQAAVPILPLDLLRRAPIALSVSGALFAFIASASILVTLPFRLHDQFGFSTAASGAVLGTWALALMFSAPTAGILSDRVAAPSLGAFGMTVATAGAVFLAMLPAAPTGFDISWRIAICAAGYAFYVSPTFRMVVNAAPASRVASAGSLMTTVRMSGQTLGATTAATMLALGLGNGSAPAVVAAVLYVLAGLLALAHRAFSSREQAHTGD